MSIIKYSKHLLTTIRHSRNISVHRSEARAGATMSLSNTAKTLKTPLVGAFQMLADPLLTGHYARLGFGAVLIDQQHGLLDERTAFECVQRPGEVPLLLPHHPCM